MAKIRGGNQFIMVKSRTKRPGPRDPRLRIPRPDIFNQVGRSFCTTYESYGGLLLEEFETRLGDKLFPGAKIMDDDILDSTGSTYYANLFYLGRIIGLLMEGRQISNEQKDILNKFSGIFDLPRNLREYAATYILQAKLFGHPEETVEQIPRLFDTLIHPLFRDRLRRSGITGRDLQEAFRQNRQIDPVEAVYMLSGALPLVLPALNGVLYIVDSAKKFANLIVKPFLPADEDPMIALWGFNDSTNLENKFMSALDKTSINGVLAFYARSLPMRYSAELDDFRRFHERPYLLNIADSFGDDLTAQQVDRVTLATYADPPTTFLGIHERAVARRSEVTWEQVDPELRARIRGFSNAREIAAFIDETPAQREFTRQLESIIRISRGDTGYMVTEYDVLLALTQPGKAYFGHGLADPLYTAIYTAVGNNVGFAEFWGVPRPVFETLEQKCAASFHAKVMDAVHGRLHGLVTNEQIALALELEPKQFTDLFERPRQNYVFSHTTKKPEPVQAMRIVQQKLGVSFIGSWQALDEERRGVEAVLAQRAAAELAERRRAGAPKPPPDPWQGIAPEVKDAIRVKFATPADLAAAIIGNIRAMPARLNDRAMSSMASEVEQALRHKGAAVTSEGLPLDIMHARILQAMGTDARAVARAMFKAHPAPTADQYKHVVLNNITALITANPNLASILGWRQFRMAFNAASVNDLVDNLYGAYRPRAQRDPTLIPRPSLAGIAAALNTGLDEAQHCQWDNIVSVATWRAAAKARSGRDPLPQNVADKDCRFALG
jgi:hypothetical protein